MAQLLEEFDETEHHELPVISLADGDPKPPAEVIEFLDALIGLRAVLRSQILPDPAGGAKPTETLHSWRRILPSLLLLILSL